MNNKIKFTDLVNKIAEETGASKRLVHDLLIETVNLTKEGLNRDGHVNLRGLGRFHLKWHEARHGRNPQTGESIEIPAHSSVNFKAEADLREYINRKYSETPKSIKEKKRSAGWLWLVIPLLIIILVYIFWPFKKVPETNVKKPVVEEVKTGTPGGQHTIKPGEKLWTISQDFYNQAYLWPNIYRANLYKVKNPDLLSIGNEIQIPFLRGKPGNLTQKDIEEIAEGFIEVYLFYKNLGDKKAQYYLWVVKKLNVNEVIDRFRDRIDEKDLELVDKIKGYPRIK